jgi:integrase/recombinase XerC
VGKRSKIPSTWKQPEIIDLYLCWIEEKRLSESTHRLYRGTLRHLAYWLETEHGSSLLGVSHRLLKEWRAQLTVDDASIVAYVTAVRIFYQWCYRSGHRKDDPAWNIPSPRLRRRKPKPIPEDPLAIAIENAPTRIRPWLVLGAFAGLRACEIATLRRENIFEDAPVPHMLVYGKGGKERYVVMSPYVWSELVLAGLPTRGPIFLRRDGKPGANRPGRVTQLCNEYLKSLGLPYTLHKLRHRFGSRGAEVSNGDVVTLGGQMGHDNTNTTLLYVLPAERQAVEMVYGIQPPGWPGSKLRPAEGPPPTPRSPARPRRRRGGSRGPSR